MEPGTEGGRKDRSPAGEYMASLSRLERRWQWAEDMVRKVQRLPQVQVGSACWVWTSSMYPVRVTVGQTAWVTTRE